MRCTKNTSKPTKNKILLGLWVLFWTFKSTGLEVVVVQELFLRQMRDFKVSKK